MALIGVKFCMMVHLVHICPGPIFPPFSGGIPGAPKSEILGLNFATVFDCEYLENGKSQRYMSEL